MDKKECPVCRSAYQNSIAEKIFKPLGSDKKTKVDPVNREQYRCGAVILVNRQYPKGILEASCCLSGQS